MATPSFVNSERHCSVRVGFQFEDGEIHHGGGFGGLCVLGAEPRRLRELGAGWGAVHQDGGSGGLGFVISSPLAQEAVPRILFCTQRNTPIFICDSPLPRLVVDQALVTLQKETP